VNEIDVPRLDLLSHDLFVAHVGDRLGVGSIRPTATFDELGLDSFHLMELVAAVDDLGVVLDEDVFSTVGSIDMLYAAYAEAAAQQTATV
jgi:acyl carrier protein